MSPAKIFVTTSLIHAVGNLDIFSQLILFCPLLLLPSIFPNITVFSNKLPLRWLNGITNSMDMSLSRLWATVEDRGAWHEALHGVAKSRM